MKKHIYSLLCILAVVLVFALTAQTMSLSWHAGAEENDPAEPTAASSSTTHQGGSQEEVAPPTTTTTTTETTTQTTTESTTQTTTESTTQTTTEKPDAPTQTTTEKKPDPTTKHEPGSENESTKASDTTTKKDGEKKTTSTTRKYTTTKRYVPPITIPVVENTTIEGTTLNPLDAYFERISGDSNTFTTVTVEETTAAEIEEMEQKSLSTISIVAICLGGIALVTVGLTAGFAIRNKRAGDDEEDTSDYEQDAYGDNAYDTPTVEMPKSSRPQVDESSSFTVVSLDDKDYKD